MERTYLGDAVYAEITENKDLVLTTSDGICVLNRIVIEPEVLINLLFYIKKSPIAQLLN